MNMNPDVAHLESQVEQYQVDYDGFVEQAVHAYLLTNILRSIALERRRQDAKWGVQNHDAPYWLAILIEEVGEVAKAIVEGHMADLRTELIQVAAVVVAIIEWLDRNRLGEKHEL